MVRCEPREGMGHCSKWVGIAENPAVEHSFIGKLLRRAGHRRRAAKTATTWDTHCVTIAANEVTMARQRGCGSSRSQVHRLVPSLPPGPIQGKSMPPAPKYLSCSLVLVVVTLLVACPAFSQNSSDDV